MNKLLNVFWNFIVKKFKKPKAFGSDEWQYEIGQPLVEDFDPEKDTMKVGS